MSAGTNTAELTIISDAVVRFLHALCLLHSKFHLEELHENCSSRSRCNAADLHFVCPRSRPNKLVRRRPFCQRRKIKSTKRRTPCAKKQSRNCHPPDSALNFMPRAFSHLAAGHCPTAHDYVGAPGLEYLFPSAFACDSLRVWPILRMNSRPCVRR